MIKEIKPPTKKGYESHTKGERAVGIIGLAIMATLCIYSLGFLYKINLNQRNILYKNIETVQHFPVDKINDHTVYLIVLNGDTLGVVAIK